MNDRPISTLAERTGSEPDPDGFDWSAFDALTDEQIAAAVAGDQDAAPIVDSSWFAQARRRAPSGAEALNVPIDRDVVEFFTGPDGRHGTRINRVLRVYMERQLKRHGA